MNRSPARRRRGLIATGLALALACLVGGVVAFAAQPISGAIFTTDEACEGTDLNIYSSKDAVYLDGGPAKEGAAGLPDGSYYVQVTEPDGTLLGTSVGTENETPVHVTGGEFDSCYQLSAILHKASDAGSPPFPIDGYDTTSNEGGEYKVWVSPNGEFPNDETKTDNFKVKEGEGGKEEEPPQATLTVRKFYDANANGVNDGDIEIKGWEFNVHDGIDWNRFTPHSMVLDPDEYVVTEFDPVQSNWFHTTENPVYVTLEDGDNKTVEFGNVCVGAGGGLTLGFWSNKNGKRIFEAKDKGKGSLALLSGLNLRDEEGNNFDPASYTEFREWLLAATAKNMAYMLSAQLAAMELNVANGKVDGSSLIYAPGTESANALGFATVNAVMAEANTELGLHGTAFSGDAWREYQEALKNALDNANNNLTFVQEEPCEFTFAEEEI
ncbi:MAG: hypothetical protein ACM3N0_12675 [Chloroflexota bacterium]